MITDSYSNMMPVDVERELGIYRSGSAPPTVEGALTAGGGLFDGSQLKGGDHIIGYGSAVSEEELRADPSYVNYYYSNVKLNPRLPPPLVSKDDLRFAHRLSGGAVGGDRKAVGRGEGSLFSVQPRFGSKEENATSGLEVRPSEWGGTDGLIGLPGLGIGSRKKSFAEMIQDDMNHGATSSRHPSRPASRNAYGEGVEISDVQQQQLKKHNELEFLDQAQHLNANKNEAPAVHSFGASVSHTYASALSASLSRSVTPDPQFVERSPTPRIPSAAVGRVGSMDKRSMNGQTNSFNNGVSHGGMMRDSGDLVNALSGLNLSPDNIILEEESRSQMHYQQMDDHRDFYSFNKDFQKPCSFVKGPSTPFLSSHDYGISGHASNPLSPSMMVNQLGTANLPPLLKNVATASAFGVNGLDPRAFGGSAMHNNLGRMNGNGNAMQFPLMDPSFVHYSRSNEYAAATQLAGVIDPILDRDALGNSYTDLLGLQKAYLDALLASQKPQYGIPYLGKSAGYGNGGYNGNLACAMGMSYPGSPLASPTFPNSPSRHEERGGMRYHSGARTINVGYLGAWHSDTGVVGLDDNFTPTLLDEFKSNKAKCFELSEITGHVVEFSADQYGSRFIQQKLETASTEEKDMVFHEIMPHALTLMTDVFGNYVIQKFFEHGSASQIRELAEQLYGRVLNLSLQMYGCRVIQKAIEVVQLDQQTVMVKELDGNVMKCVRDQNGNHVIQKCIECVPEDAIQFIVTVFYDQVVTLSTHPYGCRVIQRILEHCHDPKTQQIMLDEILDSVCMLAQDQYGNYVVQHVLEHGKPHERTAIINKLIGQIVHMSQQKFASNVIEKCLTFGTPEERQNLVDEMLGETDENDPLQVMMKDQFANYVVQKVLETCDDQQLELILNRIKIHLNALKKYTYGKHIVARVEKLVAAGERRISIQNLNASTIA